MQLTKTRISDATIFSPTSFSDERTAWFGADVQRVERGMFTALSGVSFGGLLVTYVWIISLVQLLKRLIFVAGIGSQASYYLVQLLPDVIALLLLALTTKQLRRIPLPKSAYWLIAFVGFASLNTCIYSPGVPIAARAAAMNDHIFPVSLFAVGLVLPIQSLLFRRVARALVWSAVLTVLYAAFQFMNGPTALDAAWAHAAADYSIQAQKTLMALHGDGEWRPYSYFADALTWGLFLVTAIVAWCSATRLDGRYRQLRWAPVVPLAFGLILCMTRTPWVGLVTAGVSYLLLKHRALRKASLVFCIILAGFPVIVLTGTYFYQNVFPSMASFGNSVVDRYMTLGTFEARIGSWDGLPRAISKYPIIGTGFGYSDYYDGRFSDLSNNIDVGMHNFAVELATFSGAVGLALFLLFLWAVVREATRVMNVSPQRDHVAAVGWLLAFIVGSVITGYLNGGTFMTPLFYLFAGVLAGESARVSRGVLCSAR